MKKVKFKVNDRLLWKNYLIRGDVVYVKLDKYINSCVQSGIRPCVIVSNKKSNQNSMIYNVCPFTSRMDKNRHPMHIFVNKENMEGFLEKNSLILTEQILTVDKRQVLGHLGNVSNNKRIIKLLDRNLMKQLDLEESLYWKEDLPVELINIIEQYLNNSKRIGIDEV